MGTQTPRLFLWCWFVRTSVLTNEQLTPGFWRRQQLLIHATSLYMHGCKSRRQNYRLKSDHLVSPCCRLISPRCPCFCLLVLARSLLLSFFDVMIAVEQRTALKACLGIFLYSTYIKVERRMESRRVNGGDGEEGVFGE